MKFSLPLFQCSSRLLFGMVAVIAIALSPTQGSGQAALDTIYNPSVDYNDNTINNNTAVFTVVTVPGNKILIGGSFLTVGTESAPSRMARLFAGEYTTWTPALVKSGAWDMSFFAFPNEEPGIVFGSGAVDTIGAHHRHGVVVGGNFTSIGGAGKARCARLEITDGSAQPFLPPMLWKGNVAIPPPQITQLRGGDVLIWGDFSQGRSIPPGSYDVSRVGLVRWNMPSGHFDLGLLDNNFNAFLTPDANDASAGILYALAVQDDGKILISGIFDHVNGVARTGVVRLNDDSSTDTSFSGPTSFVYAMLVQPDGKILLNYGATIARLNPNGLVDPTFLANTNGLVSSMTLRADGKLLIGGSFTSVNTVARNCLALLNSDGSLDPTFNVAVDNGAVLGLALQDNGKMYVGGTFIQVAGIQRRRLARILPDVPATSAISVDPEGTFVRWELGGSFPQLHNVDLEVSTNNSTFTSLGVASHGASGWEKAALSTTAVPDNVVFYVRATGNNSGGFFNRSESLIEKRASFLRPAPRIQTQPMSLTKNEGESASFTVVPSAVLPTAPAGTTVLPYSTMTYQWFKGTVPVVDGPNITGSQTTTLNFAAVTPGDAGTYKLVITNSAGKATSVNATLTVIVAPVISVDPMSQNIGLNKLVSFQVLLSQGTSPTYQWRFNGSPTLPTGVTGGTTSKITISKAQLLHEGQFSVVVSNSAGMDTSADATLNVIDAAPTVTPIAPQLVAVGTANVTFNPTFTSEVTPTFAWLKNAKVVAGATANPFIIPVAAVADGANYQVKVTNPLTSVTSANMPLGVVDTANRRVMGKLNASTVIAPPIGGPTGVAGLQFQWSKVGVGALADGTDYSGTKTAKLTVKTTTAADEGQYFCTVTLPGAAAPLDTGMYDLYVASPPIFTMPTTALPTGKVSDATYSFTFTDFDTDPNRTPTSFKATGLPAGLKMDPLTGVISGRPTASGSFNVRITLGNISGSVTSATGVYPLTITKLADTIVGTYVGLVDRTGSSTIPLTLPTTAVGPLGALTALGARLDLTTQTNGTFSGKITVGTKAYSFTSAILDNSVTPAKGIVAAISRGAGKTTLRLEFELDAATNLLTGTLTENTGGAVAATVNGWRNTWKTTGPVPNPATTRAGTTHNFKAVDPGMVADAALPEGASYGTAKVTTAGATSFANAKTADGTTITTTGVLGPTGQVLVYQSLYSGVGSFAGVLVIADNAAHKLTGSLTWSKDAQKSGRRYKAGWASPISLTATGGLYKPVSATTTSTTIMSLATLPTGSATLNAQLDFEGGGVGGNAPAPGTTNSATDPAINFQIFSLATPKFPAGAGNPAAVALKITNSSGVFSGSFTLKDGAVSRKILYYGIVVPDPDTADEFDGQGFGYYICNGLLPTTTTSEERSGLVNLKAFP